MTKLDEIYLRVLESVLNVGAIDSSLEDTDYIVGRIVCPLCKGHGLLRGKQKPKTLLTDVTCCACTGTGLMYVQGNPMQPEPVPDAIKE